MVSVEDVLDIVDLYDEVWLFGFGWGQLTVVFVILGLCGRLGGAHALFLAAHVSLPGLFRLREILVEVFHVDEGPCKVVAPLDGFEPGGFGGETGGGMKVSGRWFHNGELVVSFPT